MPGSRFWQFSLDFYARPRVAPACLELQDSAGVDVNVLFFLLYLASHARELRRDDVARIDADVKAWREEAVVPLRTLRRKLKAGIGPVATAETEGLRSAVKRIELEAEHIEQQWLERHHPPDAAGKAVTSKIAAAQANVAAYGEFLNGLPDPQVTTLLLEFSAHVAR